ncbi:MAG: polysaccharide biosynthesis tyrosine autokinase, partial [Actinobacteria bacterium]|nr:polysaccharide biosynthesis tyrosine autokinase [Actinomycetota bacterium]
WIIALAVVVVVAGAFAMWYREDPVYEATAELRLGPGAAERVVNENQDNSSDAVTEILVMQSPAVRRAVRADLGYVPAVSIEQVEFTEVVTITASAGNAKRAATGANGYARSYIDYRRDQIVDDILAAAQTIQEKIAELDERLASLPAGSEDADRIAGQRVGYAEQLDGLQVSASLADQGGGEIIALATAPGSPENSSPIRNGIAALGIGLVLGIGLAFLREYLDDTIKTKDDLERAAGTAAIGLIPAVPGWRDRSTPRLVAHAQPTSPSAEAYRTLRTSVQFLGVDRPIRTLQVTSAIAAEGKTTTLANLAVTFAQAGHRVVILCCDLRRPRVHRFFGLDNDVGFTSVLVGDASLSDAIQPVPDVPGIAVLASGPPPPNPSELLSSNRAAEVIAALEARCDLLLVDSAPIVPVT